MLEGCIALRLICNQDPDGVTQRHWVTRDCTYFKTHIYVKGLGMVPKEQRKTFPPCPLLSSNLEPHLQSHCNPTSSPSSQGG